MRNSRLAIGVDLGLADPLGYQKRLPTNDVYVVAEKILVEPDKAKRDQLIEQAYKIAQEQDWGYIPLHQQALAWGVSKKVKLTQRADNQVLLYWATKQE